MVNTRQFSYEEAFDRNIGWLTEWEQATLRGKRVAIAGMGGVGGVHLLTLVRLGIGSFSLADFDTFDLANFNRQAGASMDTVDRPKLDVMAEMALAINPELHIRRFPQGVTAESVDSFLDGVDLFIDGFDFFAIPIRMQVFARCAALRIPAVTAAPIGMGTGFLTFTPGGMTFEQYFRLEGQSENEQFLRFLMGVAPRGLHRSYLVDPARIDLAARKGPSTAASCQLCAGVIGVQAVKLLLNRGELKPAPYHHHFDPYVGRYAVTYLPQGNDTPMQRVRLAVARRAYGKPRPARTVSPPMPHTPITTVLEAARWAPSGDNSQPWRFELVDDETVRIHLGSEADTNPYEYRGGEPTLLSGGMLLETMRIIASTIGRKLVWSVERGTDPYTILARVPLAPGVLPDDLSSVVQSRSVDRRPYTTRALTPFEKETLEAVVGNDLVVTWFESRMERLQMGRLGAAATDIRLRAHETFIIHQQVLDWSGGHSPTGLPAAAIGLDRATLLAMKWGMKTWSRMRAMNRVAGTWAAAVQLDIIPALGSAAFFALAPRTVHADRVVHLLTCGASIQRFWLRATRLGLALQPNIATLIFAHYGAAGIEFTKDARLKTKARILAARTAEALGDHAADFVFFGRVGQPKAGIRFVRSIRRALSSLTIPDSIAK